MADQQHRIEPFCVLRSTEAVECQCIAWHPARTHLFCGYSDGNGHLWSLQDRRVSCSLTDIHTTDGGVIHAAFIRNKALSHPSAAEDKIPGSPKAPALLLITQGKEGLVKVWAWSESTCSLDPTPLHVLSTGAYGFCRVSAVYASLPESPHHAHNHTNSHADARGPGEPSTSSASPSGLPPLPPGQTPLPVPKRGGLSALLGGERRRSQNEGSASSTLSGDLAEEPRAPPAPPRLLVVHSCEAKGVLRVTDVLRDAVVLEWAPPDSLNRSNSNSSPGPADVGMGMLMSVETLTVTNDRTGAEHLYIVAGYEDGRVIVLAPSRHAPSNLGGNSARGLDMLARMRVAHDAATSLAVIQEKKTGGAASGGEKPALTVQGPSAGSRPDSASSASGASLTHLVFRGAVGSTTSEISFFKMNLTLAPPHSLVSVTDECKLETRGHLEFPTPGLNDLRTKPDGKLVASAGWDGKIRVFDIRRSKALAILKYHSKAATAVAYPEDLALGGVTKEAEGNLEPELLSDGLFATCARDGTVALWTLYGSKTAGPGGESSKTSV